MKLRLSTCGSWIQVIDAIGVEQRRPALDAVNFIAFVEQKLGEIGAVLTGNTGNQSYFFHRLANKGT